MRLKLTLLVIVLAMLSTGRAQVLNSGISLKSDKFRLGLLPTVLSDNFGIFVQGGYGLRSDMDINFRIGAGYPDMYVGADLEFMILTRKPYFSVSAGAHYFGDVGLDASGTFTIPIDPQVHLYTGLDMDIIFNEDKTNVPFWFRLGAEVAFKKNLSILLEAGLGINDPAYSIFSGGFNIYF